MILTNLVLCIICQYIISIQSYKPILFNTKCLGKYPNLNSLYLFKPPVNNIQGPVSSDLGRQGQNIQGQNIQGQDQRYPIQSNQTDEINRHILNHMRMNLLKKLRSESIGLETKLDLIKYSDIPNINTNSIKGFNIKSGGLMDDWNNDHFD